MAHGQRADSFPPLIFQTWKSKDAMPGHFARWSESLRRLNPDYAYVLWDDADNRGFIATHHPWFCAIYDAYPREIYRVDAVRYFFLYQFGGVYADMDTECLRPLQPLFHSGDVWLGRMGHDRTFAHSIPNAIMASRPRQAFWLLVIALLVENAHTLRDRTPPVGPETMTGPILLKRAYDLYVGAERGRVRAMIEATAARLPASLQPRTGSSQVRLLEPDVWYPIDWSNIIHLRLSRETVDYPLSRTLTRWLFPRSYLVTFWTHSW
ncbi:MAG: glycosyltransferase [Casimicrobiaceae bacterium]